MLYRRILLSCLAFLCVSCTSNPIRASKALSPKEMEQSIWQAMKDYDAKRIKNGLKAEYSQAVKLKRVDYYRVEKGKLGSAIPSYVVLDKNNKVMDDIAIDLTAHPLGGVDKELSTRVPNYLEAAYQAQVKPYFNKKGIKVLEKYNGFSMSFGFNLLYIKLASVSDMKKLQGLCTNTGLKGNWIQLRLGGETTENCGIPFN